MADSCLFSLVNTVAFIFTLIRRSQNLIVYMELTLWLYSYLV